MPSPFVFFDLRTTDASASRRFYTNLFDWPVADVPAGRDTIPLMTDGDEPWGGFTQLDPDDPRVPMWIPYVPVDDVDAAAQRALELGASLIRERTDLPVGSLVVLADPGGAPFTLWKAAT